MKTPKPHIRTRAFSLVEMLSVVAVIGIVSAIAVPNIGRINESARIAAAKRNAQSIASVCASAQAAGLDFVTDDLTQSIANVVQGGTASEGVFAGAFFGVPALSEAERFAATRYLLLDGDNLVYQANIIYNELSTGAEGPISDDVGGGGGRGDVFQWQSPDVTASYQDSPANSARD